MNDQAASLRALAGQLRRDLHRLAEPAVGGRVVVVFSGKGGVGKTVVSVNLGVVLAQRGHRVALFDADVGLANADLVLGAIPSSYLGELVRLGPAWQPPDAPFQLVGGGSGDPGLLELGAGERRRLLAALRNLQRVVDLTLVDAGAGLGPTVTGLVSAADELVLITTPEPTALADAEAALQVVGRYNRLARVWAVCNRARHAREGHHVLAQLGGLGRRHLGLPPLPLGYVVDDPALEASVRAGEPVVGYDPAAPSSQCLVRLAERLWAGGSEAIPTQLGQLVGEVGGCKD